MNSSNLNLKLILPAVAAVILLLAAGGYFYFQSQKPQSPQPGTEAAQEEVRKLVTEVGKLMELPVGENPTIATVTDVEKLQNQPFFQKAQNGDQVLIYQVAGKAILYRPSLKRIIDVAPLTTSTSSAQVASPSPSPLYTP